MSDDYYELLGVERGAGKDEIKKAFRKKAQQYHPDKPDGDEAKFKAVNEAYSVLSDEKKKQQYDTFGKAGAAGGGFGGFDFSGFGNGAGGFEFDLGDIFSQFGGFGGSRSRAHRGSNISVQIEISFRDSVFGVEKDIELDKNNVCTECDGTGAHKKKTKTCHECDGSGQVTMIQQTIMGQVRTNRICQICDGRGEVPEENCHTCNGSGVVQGREKITIKIPAGIEDGQQLRLQGRGEAIASGQPGDLYILVRVIPESGYHKEGRDVYMTAKISPTEALLGSKKMIETLDGSVTIKIPAGSEHGKQLRIKDKGVVITENKRGDLYVQLLIEIPSKLTKEQKKILEQLRNAGL